MCIRDRYKPGEPVEEVPYEWNGIVFDDVFDDEYSSERILYFDVPLEYLGKDYFDEEEDVYKRQAPDSWTQFCTSVR